MEPPKINKFYNFLMKILYIYSKLEDGWSIQKLEDDKFEFKRILDGEVSTIDLFK
jgi:hypothetical protein